MKYFCFHRDLKLSNIMINIKDNIINYYLIDFSESNILDKDKMNETLITS